MREAREIIVQLDRMYTECAYVAMSKIEWQTLKTAVLAQQTTSTASTPCPQCIDFGVIAPLVNYCKTCGRKLPEHGAHCR